MNQDLADKCNVKYSLNIVLCSPKFFSLHFTVGYGIYGVSGDLYWECDSTFPYRGTLY